MLILLALQSNSTGSVLINDGTLGAGIRELKPGAAASIPIPNNINKYKYKFNAPKIKYTLPHI